MKLISPAFDHNEEIPCKYTCDGENLNPPLTIADVPSDAKSLILIMDKPGVSEGGGEDSSLDHWLVFNIPSNIGHIAEGQEPSGTHGTVKHGIFEVSRLNYHGPCPADGEHLYRFKLYALDSELALLKNATRRRVEEAMAGRILAEAELVGRYQMNLACHI